MSHKTPVLKFDYVLENGTAVAVKLEVESPLQFHTTIWAEGHELNLEMLDADKADIETYARDLVCHFYADKADALYDAWKDGKCEEAG